VLSDQQPFPKVNSLLSDSDFTADSDDPIRDLPSKSSSSTPQADLEDYYPEDPELCWPRKCLEDSDAPSNTDDSDSDDPDFIDPLLEDLPFQPSELELQTFLVYSPVALDPVHFYTEAEPSPPVNPHRSFRAVSSYEAQPIDWAASFIKLMFDPQV